MIYYAHQIYYIWYCVVWIVLPRHADKPNKQSKKYTPISIIMFSTTQTYLKIKYVPKQYTLLTKS